MKKIVYSILLIFVMSIIFIFSNQNADISSNVSDGFIDKTVIGVYKIFNPDASIGDMELIRGIAVFPIRKLAHVTIYLILGILFYLFISEFNITKKNIFLIAILCCILYSISDEIHQLLIVGRSGEIRDVFLDTCGSFIGIVLISKLKKTSNI